MVSRHMAQRGESGGNPLAILRCWVRQNRSNTGTASGWWIEAEAQKPETGSYQRCARPEPFTAPPAMLSGALSYQRL